MLGSHRKRRRLSNLSQDESSCGDGRIARVGTGASPVQAEQSSAAAGIHNNSGFAPLFSLRDRLAFSNLLPPHRVVQPFLVKQLRVPSKFNDASTLQHVDSVGVHHR